MTIAFDMFLLLSPQGDLFLFFCRPGTYVFVSTYVIEPYLTKVLDLTQLS